jgi:hypothetical protein
VSVPEIVSVSLPELDSVSVPEPPEIAYHTHGTTLDECPACKHFKYE